MNFLRIVDLELTCSKVLASRIARYYALLCWFAQDWDVGLQFTHNALKVSEIRSSDQARCLECGGFLMLLVRLFF